MNQERHFARWPEQARRAAVARPRVSPALRRCSPCAAPAFAQSAAGRRELDALDKRITPPRGHEPDRASAAHLWLLRRQEPVGAARGAFLGRRDAGDRRQRPLHRQAARARVHADRLRARRREGRLARQSHAVPVDPRHLGGRQERLDPFTRVRDEPRRLGPAAVRERVQRRKTASGRSAASPAPSRCTPTGTAGQRTP